MSTTPELEAMARAIAVELAEKYGVFVTHPYDLARVGLTAVRELDEDGIVAHIGASVCSCVDCREGVGTVDRITAVATFQAMIDHILSQHQDGGEG